MAAIYDVTELSTAVKPWLFEELFRRESSPVTYLDPDIRVFSQLAEIEPLLEPTGMVLTPHRLTATPRDDLEPSELTILRAGLFNLGFLALAPQRQDLIPWWQERLRRDCRNAVHEGVFVDQRWMDFASTVFPHTVLRHPGYNVAYWNADARRVENKATHFEVDGEPLRFFHFSGFSPLYPHLLSRHLVPSPRVRLEDQPAIARICVRYTNELVAAGYFESIATPYRYNMTPRGKPLDRRTRAIYRLALDQAERELICDPPDPFDEEDEDAFNRWISEVTEGESVSRYFAALFAERADLRDAFGSLGGEGGVRYADWVARHGRRGSDSPPQYLPTWRPRREEFMASAEVALADGVNVVGYLDAEDGVGEVSRLLVEVLEAAEIDYRTVAVADTPSRRLAVRKHHESALPLDINVICVNADSLPLLFERPHEIVPPARTNVGVWAWEVSEMPEWMAQSEYFLDEVWVYSQYAAESVRRSISTPVYVVPPPIIATAPTEFDRGEVGISEAFTFLFCFNYNSVFDRKNPIGLVEAYRRAFPSPESARLIIKSVHGSDHPVAQARLAIATGGRPDISLRDGYESSARQRALIERCDAYVSLHRSEGYGLTMAEAMAAGKPVVATGYSGNVDFMNDHNSLLVRHEVVPVGLGSPPYPPQATWADPDLDHAAALFRELYEHPELGLEVGRAARLDVERLHAPRSRLALVSQRLDALRAAR